MSARRNFAVLATVALIGCSGVPEETEDAERISEQLIGNTDNFLRLDSWARSVGFIEGTGCTGTVVGTNKVLSAAHCFCVGNRWIGSGTGLAFELPDTLDSGYQTAPGGNVDGHISWPVLRVESPRGNDFCSNPIRQVSPWDIAVLTLGPGTHYSSPTALVYAPKSTANPPLPVLAQPVLLDDPDVDPTLIQNAQRTWLAGFGRNVDDEWEVPGPSAGSGVRRTANLSTTMDGVRFFNPDPCDQLGEQKCFRHKVWRTLGMQVDGRVFAETTKGDSGGPLYVNDGRVLVGVVSFGTSGLEQYWAGTHLRTGDGNADWLWKALERPYTLSRDQLRRSVAVYALGAPVRVNDRAEIRATPASLSPQLVSHGSMRLGADAKVAGDVWARGNIAFEDRATVDGSVQTYSRLLPDFGTAHSKRVGRHMMFPAVGDLGFPAAESSGSGWRELPDAASGKECCVEEGLTLLAPGRYGDLTVRSNWGLRLTAGKYVFRDITFESGSELDFDTSDGPIWIFVAGRPIFRNTMRGGPASDTAANVFVVVQSDDTVVVNDLWGTILAPSSSVIVDRSMVGAVFAKDFELHQGRILWHTPNLNPWSPTCDGFVSCH